MSQPFRIKNDFEIAGDLTAESGARFGRVLDPDADAYIQAVEAADGQQLELAVRFALDDFVKGCKSDGIWDAIKASCIMAGARTLGGALVPLRGTAPTNFNFVSGDYNRKTGLKGNGSTKYLDSNRANNTDPQNSKHLSAFQSETGGVFDLVMGESANSGGSQIFINTANTVGARANSSAPFNTSLAASVGLLAIVRSDATDVTARANATSETGANASATPTSPNLLVFRRQGTGFYFSGRLSFYSIGESLDLAALDTRVSALMTAIDAAII
jgi:hypothetical protein